MEKAFPLLKCLRTNYGRHCEPFSGQKCSGLQDFAYAVSKFFEGDIPGLTQREGATPLPYVPADPGAWTQASVSAWLASVPIVPVLRNDHCVLMLFALWWTLSGLLRSL